MLFPISDIYFKNRKTFPSALQQTKRVSVISRKPFFVNELEASYCPPSCYRSLYFTMIQMMVRHQLLLSFMSYVEALRRSLHSKAVDSPDLVSVAQDMFPGALSDLKQQKAGTFTRLRTARGSIH